MKKNPTKKLTVSKKLNVLGATELLQVPLHRHDHVYFKAHAQTIEVDGEPVEYHLRQPGDEPALKVRGKWYIVRIRDLAKAIINKIGGE